MRRYDVIDGYRLEVGPGWRGMSPAERAEVCNGVGSAGQPPWLASLLAKLPYLLPASRPHDVDYHVGGTSADRLRADRRFRRNCLAVARAQIGPWWKRWLVPGYRVAWLAAVAEINAAYATLRWLGGNAFNYAAMAEPALERK
jgi:hypothetical protein